jgi:hypothetical protein
MSGPSQPRTRTTGRIGWAQIWGKLADWDEFALDGAGSVTIVSGATERGSSCYVDVAVDQEMVRE